MEKKFKPIEFNVGEEYIPTLKKAMKSLEENTFIKNTTITLTKTGFTINEETDEKFLFNFGIYYGKFITNKY